MKTTTRTRSRGVLVAVTGLLAFVICSAAPAIPTGSMGLRTFDVHGNELGLIKLRVERYAGPYLIDPMDVMTDEYALVWVGVPAQTYAIYAIGNTGEPFPGPPLQIVTVPGGAHDLLVYLTVPTPCPGDVNDDRTTGVTDFLILLEKWGQLGGPADINDDGTVNVNDLLALPARWGACPD